MATVPQLATYTSEDKNFKIQVTAANPSNGQISYVYETTYSPEGPFTEKSTNGVYSWVGKTGAGPFCIRFVGGIRPPRFPYCIYDAWTGAYRADNTLLMEGSRSYVNDKGVVQVTSLGTLKFSQ